MHTQARRAQAGHEVLSSASCSCVGGTQLSLQLYHALARRARCHGAHAEHVRRSAPSVAAAPAWARGPQQGQQTCQPTSCHPCRQSLVKGNTQQYISHIAFCDAANAVGSCMIWARGMAASTNDIHRHPYTKSHTHKTTCTNNQETSAC